eukprot:TRINITY_DN7181_c0_g1_i8.p1 TRINITY_DN7181_c0_g1~~TRINITY_DN7181_c0_g1_i8.p1  ORF type:complete len:258 (-),score=-5.35 TRINITY_DN7181_c0_g1_i8:122-895(-)
MGFQSGPVFQSQLIFQGPFCAISMGENILFFIGYFFNVLDDKFYQLNVVQFVLLQVCDTYLHTSKNQINTKRFKIYQYCSYLHKRTVFKNKLVRNAHINEQVSFSQIKLQDFFESKGIKLRRVIIFYFQSQQQKSEKLFKIIQNRSHKYSQVVFKQYQKYICIYIYLIVFIQNKLNSQLFLFRHQIRIAFAFVFFVLQVTRFFFQKLCLQRQLYDGARVGKVLCQGVSLEVGESQNQQCQKLILFKELFVWKVRWNE